MFPRGRDVSGPWVLVYRPRRYYVGLLIAASAENMATSVVLAFLAAASTVCAIGLLMGNPPLVEIAGYLFVGSAVYAWYAASALMLREAFGREVWSIGRSARALQIPRMAVGPEPGMIHGQA